MDYASIISYEDNWVSMRRHSLMCYLPPQTGAKKQIIWGSSWITTTPFHTPTLKLYFKLNGKTSILGSHKVDWRCLTYMALWLRATSPQRLLFFGGQSIHLLLFKPLYKGHFPLSPNWPLRGGPTELTNPKAEIFVVVKLYLLIMEVLVERVFSLVIHILSSSCWTQSVLPKPSLECVYSMWIRTLE